MKTIPYLRRSVVLLKIEIFISIEYFFIAVRTLKNEKNIYMGLGRTLN